MSMLFSKLKTITTTTTRKTFSNAVPRSCKFNPLPVPQLLEQSEDPPSNDPDMKSFSPHPRPDDDGVLVQRNYISMTAVGGFLSNEVGRFRSLKQQVVPQTARLLHRVCSRWSPCAQHERLPVNGITKSSELTWTGCLLILSNRKIILFPLKVGKKRFLHYFDGVGSCVMLTA